MRRIFVFGYAIVFSSQNQIRPIVIGMGRLIDQTDAISVSRKTGLKLFIFGINSSEYGEQAGLFCF